MYEDELLSKVYGQLTKEIWKKKLCYKFIERNKLIWKNKCVCNVFNPCVNKIRVLN